MFCPKCGSEIAEGSAFCGKCGARVGAPVAGAAPAGAAAQGAAGGAGAGAPAPKKGGAKVGVIAAAAVVVVVLIAGFATNWFGLAGVQPKEAVEVPAASQSSDDAPDGSDQDAASDQGGESSEGDVQGEGAAPAATVKSAVEAYTWEELSQISAEIGAAGDEAAAIEMAKKYNLVTADGKLDGTQVKLVTLTNNMTVPVQIVGFAHDDKTAGDKAGITFMFGDAITEAPMNPSDTNAGGWEASQLRAYLNSDGMALLPEDLQKVVAPVDKLTNNVGETQDISSVTTTSDSLWLPSFAELAGPIPASELWGGGSEWAAAIFNAEGSQYKLFRDANIVWDSSENPILVKNYQGSPSVWWERSPDPSYSGGFRSVGSDGYPGIGDIASYSNGVVPGFCI